MYGYIDRLHVPGLFRTFDFPSPDATSPQRDSTTVPQQALFLLERAGEQDDLLFEGAELLPGIEGDGVEHALQAAGGSARRRVIRPDRRGRQCGHAFTLWRDKRVHTGRGVASAGRAAGDA